MKKFCMIVLCLLMMAQTLGMSDAREEEKEDGSEEFQEVVVADNEECAVIIREIDPDDLWGYTLKAQMENKSSDKTYMFSVESASVDGVMNDPFFATEIAPGMRANKDISFSTSTLEDIGIEEVTDIELTFRVYDSDDWLADPVCQETVHVYPLGEDNATVYERPAQDTDTVLIDNDMATAIVTGYRYDDLWGYTADVYLVNKTDATVMFTVDDAAVNGYMADPFFATSINPGKCAFDSISWSDSTFEENGISEVETISFTLRVYDSDDWLKDDYVNQSVTLTPAA